MIIAQETLNASVDAWYDKGQNADAFNRHSAKKDPEIRRVSMASANDYNPGILGYSR